MIRWPPFQSPNWLHNAPPQRQPLCCEPTPAPADFHLSSFRLPPKHLCCCLFNIAVFLTPLRQFNLSPKPEVNGGRVSNCCSVAQSCPTLWDPMDCSMPGSSRSFTSPSLCPLDQWCYPTISSSAALFSFCLLSFLTSGSFPMCHLFASGGQRIGALPSAPVLPMSIQGWFPLGLIGLISVLSKGPSRVFPRTTIWKHQFFSLQHSLWSTFSHEIRTHLLLGRTAMTNLHSVLKRRDITSPTKIHIVKAMVFPVVMYGCESWTIKSL